MGQSPPGETYNNKGIGLPFFQGKAEFGDVYPSPQTWCNAPIKIAKSDDILISVRAPVGSTNLAAEICCIGRGLAAIRVKPDLIDRDYLWFFLRASENYLISKGQGSTFESINASDLCSLEIPVQDIKIQRKIATKLKAQLAEVENAHKALESQKKEIVNLANAFIRESIEQSSVTEHRLGDVLEEVKKGIGENWQDYPVLGATRDGLAPAKEPTGKQPQRYKPVFCGTVFYNPMRILIGSIAFVDDDDEPGITSPDYVALQGKAGQVDSRWFYYWLRSPYGEQCINSLARGAVRERMLFNRLAEGSIMLPPYPEQLKVSKALAMLKPTKYAIQKQRDDLDKIPERLLAHAFEIK
jgi:type I restriction enzyme S subunit